MRFILSGKDYQELFLALRAAEWLAKNTIHKDVIISYGSGGDYYARRNKESISVRRCDNDKS